MAVSRRRIVAALLAGSAVLALPAGAVWGGGAKESAAESPEEIVEQAPQELAELLFLSPGAGIVTHRYVARQCRVMGSSVVELDVQGSDWTDRVAARCGAAPWRWMPVRPSDEVVELFSAEADASWFSLSPTDAFALSGGVEMQGASEAVAELTGDSRFDIVAGAPAFVASARGGQEQYTVLMGKAGTGTYAQLRLTVPGEFFSGEAALFSGVTVEGASVDEVYVKRALAWMSSLLAGSPVQERFRTGAAKALGLQDVPWDAFAGKGELAAERRWFLDAFQTHLRVRQEEVEQEGAEEEGAEEARGAPVLEWPAGSFDAVYGASPSPYTAGWLRYCFEVGKPVLAGLMNASLGTMPNYRHDWNDYQVVDAGEGVELACAALRYLCWGLGYELETEVSGGRPAFEAETIGGDDDLGSVRSWVLYASGQDPLRDYLPDGTNASRVAAASLQAHAERYAPGLSAEEGAAVLAAVAPPAEWVAGEETPRLTTTPYSVPGNPVAWVPGGVDTPRTFVYKQFEQLRAGEWLRRYYAGSVGPAAEAVTGLVLATVVAKVSVEGYGARYRSFDDSVPPLVTAGMVPAGMGDGIGMGVLDYQGPGDVVKPYRSGVEVDGLPRKADPQARGLNDPDRSAGVDAAGLLGGCLAMSGLSKRVLSIRNEPLGEHVRGYASMRSGEAGAAARGLDIMTYLPVYNAGSNGWPDSVQDGAYRFSRVDVERASVLVPELSLVQLGDLVLGPGEGDRYELGIVVGMTGRPARRSEAGFDPRTERRKIIVLSANKTVGHVFVSRWENGCFTHDPDAFQLRRLVRLRSGKRIDRLGTYPEDEVDLVTLERGEAYLKVRFSRDEHASRRSGSFEPDRKIPNTGDMLQIAGIEVRRIGNLAPGEGDVEAAILGLEDYGYAAGFPGNVAVNAGSGGIELRAQVSDETWELLGSFTRREGEATYAYTASTLGAGPPQGGNGLYVSSGSLVYRSGSGDARRFGLSIPEGARPGDDFLLRIEVYSGPASPRTLTAEAGDCFTVYDKKLLWRAQQYIAEGSGDWNNCNRWSGDIDWNVAAAQGGQLVEIVSATAVGNRTVQGAVAYSLQAHDSPAEYNAKLGDQKTILNYRTEGGWTLTTAPGNLWNGYVGEAVVEALRGDEKASDAVKLARPYRPGYSSYYLSTWGEGKWNEWYDQPNYVNYGAVAIRQSAGVDCAGLVHRSASYDDEEYKLESIQPYQWDDMWPSSRRVYIVTQEDRSKNSGQVKVDKDRFDLWKIAEMDPRGYPPPNLDKIVPGDVMYYLLGRRYHVMLVAEVRHAAGRKVRMKHILLIEAASGDYQAEIGLTDRVIAKRSLDAWDGLIRPSRDRPAKWVIGRLIQEAP